MSLSVGIVGLPNVGKSTLFNALLRRQMASVSERPFTTIKPNIGVVEVPDERLSILAKTLGINKQTPTTVKFIDIAGLVKGAHQGEGLGNKFLSHIRQTTAIIHVLRGFVNDQAPHISGEIDPVHDLTTVNLELILSDFELITKHLADLAKKVKTETSLKPEIEALERAKQVLEQGELLSQANLDPADLAILKPLNLLTLKPTLYLLNLNETSVAASEGWSDWSSAKTESKLPKLLICSAKLEVDLNDLEPVEQLDYLKAMGLKTPVLDRLIREAYQLLDLISFFTVKGGKKVQAWPLIQGSGALAAAAAVHTDFAKRFIKAEVVDWQALIKAGSWSKAKDKGLINLVGKDYLIKDAEVIEFKFGPK